MKSVAPFLYRTFIILLACTGILLATACSRAPDEAVAPEPETTDPAATVEVSEEPAAPVIEEIPVSTSSDTARKLFTEGQYLIDVGRGVQAREKFRAAIAEDPAFVRAYFGQSNAALSFKEFQGLLDTATAYLQQASAGEQLMIHINRTFLSNDAARGVSLAKELVDNFPNSLRAKIVLAAMLINQNDHQGARQVYEQVLAMNPKSAAALYGMANSYLFGEPKDFGKADEWIRVFTAAYPDEAKGYETLGDINRAQNNLRGAVTAYNQAATKDPTLEVALHKKGHVNSFMGNIEDARADYDAAVAAAPPESKAGYAVYKAFTRIHEGDVAAAISELETLTDNIPAMGTPPEQVKGLQVFALTSGATAALHSRMLDKAAEIIERRNDLQMAIADDVGTDDAKRLQTANCRTWDGLLAAYQGNTDAAAEHAATVSSLVESDDNPRKMEPVHWILGMSALQAGDNAKAVEHLRKADHANNMFIRYHLALAEDAVGNSEAAKKMFDEVARFNFNSVGFALVKNDAKLRAN